MCSLFRYEEKEKNIIVISAVEYSKEKFELVVRDKNKSDDLWLKKKRFIMNFTFKIRRNLVQDIYNKHFGGK